MFSYLFIFHTRQIHFHWVEWPDLSLSRVSILHKMAVRLTMIRRFWHLMVTVYSLLDNAPNYLVGCIIQKRNLIFMTLFSQKSPTITSLIITSSFQKKRAHFKTDFMSKAFGWFFCIIYSYII